MSISQRISKKTKHKLNEIQARFVLDKNHGKKISLPELIDQMVAFIDDHFEKFKDDVASKVNHAPTGKPLLPAFLQMAMQSNATGGPDDYVEYDFNDV